MIPKSILKNFINEDESFYVLDKETGEVQEGSYTEDDKLIKTIVYEFTESIMKAFDEDTFENKLSFLKVFTGLENITEFDIVDAEYDVDREIYCATIDLYGKK